jgi:hypothetical protein
VLFGIVPFGQPDHEGAVHILDVHLFRRFLRPQRGHCKDQRKAASRGSSVKVLRFHLVSQSATRDPKQPTSFSWKHLQCLKLAGAELSSYDLRMFS